MVEAGLKMEDTASSKNKYVLVLNHDAVKKAQKQIEKAQKQATNNKSTWSPLTRFIKKRQPQRSVSFSFFLSHFLLLSSTFH